MSNMIQSEQSDSSPELQRLPSTRPIDRRWDRSRGIVFSNAGRGIRNDRTWSRDDGITFGVTPSYQREYATRPLLNPTQANSRAPPSPVNSQFDKGKGRPQNPSFDPFSASVPQQAASGSQELVRENEQLKRRLAKVSEEQAKAYEAKWAAQKNLYKKEVAAQKKDLQDTLSAEKRKLEESFHDQFSQLKQQVKDKDKQLKAKDDYVRKEIDGLKTQYEYNERESRRLETLHDRERDIKSREAGHNAVVLKAQRSADATAAARIEKAEAAVSEREAAMSKRGGELEESKLRLASVQRKEIQQQGETLRRRMAERFGQEVLTAKEAVLHRENVERADYESYHRLFDNVSVLSRAYSQELKHISTQRTERKKRTMQMAAEFQRSEISPWFSVRYPAIQLRMRELSNKHNAEVRAETQELDEFRGSLDQVREDFTSRAHYSRGLTRHHHFSTPDRYASVSLANRMLNELPLRRLRESLDGKITAMRAKLDSETDADKQRSLRTEFQSMRKKRAEVATMLTFYVRFREVQALEALRQDSSVEKEMHCANEKSNVILEQAGDAWEAHLVELGKTSEKSNSAAWAMLQKSRNQFVQERQAVRQAQRDYEDFRRKQHLLEVHLGDTKVKGSAYDATIDAKLVRANESMETSLEDLFSQEARPTGGRSRPTAFTQPVRPTVVMPIAVVKKDVQGRQSPPQVNPARLSDNDLSSIAPSTAAQEEQAHDKGPGRSLADLEQAIAREKVKRKSWSSGTSAQEKMDSALKIRNWMRELLTARLEIVQQRRVEASKVSPHDAVRAANLAVEEDRLRKTLSRMESRSLTFQTSAFASGEMRVGGRQRPASLRPSTRKSVASPNGVRGKQSKAEKFSNSVIRESGSFSFRPTAARQSPHRYSMHTLRALHAGHTKTDGRLSDSAVSPALNPMFDFFESAMPLSEALRGTPPSPSAHVAHAHHDYTDADLSESLDNLVLADQSATPSVESDAGSLAYASNDSDLDYTPALATESSMIQTVGVMNAMGSHSSPEDVLEPYAALTYRVPSADLKNALIASRSSNAHFWSHKLYKNSTGQEPKVLYCINYDQAEERAKEFLGEDIIGFDIEWEMSRQDSIKRCVSLIQIAAEDKIALFHIGIFRGDTIEALMPPTLRAILESRDVIKAGVNISGDATRMCNHLGVNMRGLFELSHLYRIVTCDKPSDVNKKLVKLATQVQHILGLPLKKDDVRTSAWSKGLNTQQAAYAAADAYAGFQLFHALEAKRMNMDPAPPRPAFWEDKKPLVLGNGMVIETQTWGRSKRDAADWLETTAEIEEDDNDESYDAIEELDVDQESPAANFSHGSSDSYQSWQSLSSSGVARVSHKDPSAAVRNDHAIEDSSRPGTAGDFTSTAFERADQWATNWRASVPFEYKVKARHAELRAYHLWHEQGLECDVVARILRNPPLETQTVANYVMQALQEEHLPCDAIRARQALNLLPKVVHHRFRKVMERIG